MTATLYHAWRALRLYQWTKNVLVLVPLILAHRWHDATALWQAALAFLAFGLAASSIYVANDIHDLEADRAHPRKRHRPFASGALPVRAGWVMAPALLAGAAALAALLPAKFSLALGGYVVIATLYSFWLKSVVLVDVVLLAALYTTRIVAGAMAIDVPVSFWLLAFSIFIFFSLAMVKRYSELHNLKQRNRTQAAGRGYITDDLASLSVMGVASGYIAVLVMALYINDPRVSMLYRTPGWLWVICPAILFWLSRVWLVTHRGEMNEDPVWFAVKDPYSYGVALVSAAGLWLAL